MQLFIVIGILQLVHAKQLQIVLKLVILIFVVYNNVDVNGVLHLINVYHKHVYLIEHNQNVHIFILLLIQKMFHFVNGIQMIMYVPVLYHRLLKVTQNQHVILIQDIHIIIQQMVVYNVIRQYWQFFQSSFYF